MKLELTFMTHILVPHVTGNNQAGRRLASQSLLKFIGSFDEVLGRIMRGCFHWWIGFQNFWSWLNTDSRQFCLSKIIFITWVIGYFAVESTKLQAMKISGHYSHHDKGNCSNKPEIENTSDSQVPPIKRRINKVCYSPYCLCNSNFTLYMSQKFILFSVWKQRVSIHDNNW